MTGERKHISTRGPSAIVQVRVMNRPENALFFVTAGDDKDSEPGQGYKSVFEGMMAGHWHLRPEQWVFLLCASLRAVICEDGDAGMRLRELDFSATDDNDAGGAQGKGRQHSGGFCFTRWLHRLDIPCIHRPCQSLVHAVERIDPLAYNSGCDRLVWARAGEARPSGEPELDISLSTKLATLRQGSKKGGKRKRVEDTIPGGLELAEVTESAHSILTRFGRERYRADDAFRGQAYCQVQCCDVSATPVSVMPVFECGRDGGAPIWLLGANRTSDKVSRAMQEFAGTQGALISNYYQLRLNLLINPNSTYDGLS